jgi:hypothetical protein
MSEPRFQLIIAFRANVVVSADKTRAFVSLLLEHGGDLVPARFDFDEEPERPVTPDAVAAVVEASRKPPNLYFMNDLGIWSHLVAFEGRDPGATWDLNLPQSLLPGRGEQLIELADALCRASAPLFGRAQLEPDVRLAKDPNWASSSPPKQLHQAYWLTILGPALVKQLGAERVAATPAYRVETYKHGAALVVTTPDPAAALTAPARQAQARATAYLRPSVDERQLLATLLERSAKLAAPTAPSRTIADPTEWRPAAEALPPDVDDVERANARYSLAAEEFIAAFHTEIEGLTEESPDSLRRIDEYLLERDYWDGESSKRATSLLVPAIGAYAGMVLVRKLDGRWVPRRNPDETAVIVGDRAWHPFLRVRRMFESRAAMIAHPLALLYDAAAAHR